MNEDKDIEKIYLTVAKREDQKKPERKVNLMDEENKYDRWRDTEDESKAHFIETQSRQREERIAGYGR